jgi:hypothetical protein
MKLRTRKKPTGQYSDKTLDLYSEVLGQNPGRGTEYPDIFRDFFQALLVNLGYGSRFRPDHFKTLHT